MKIGFFDSGIGGLTVLADAIKYLKGFHHYLYFADTENIPYGTKETEEVREHVLKAADFMASQDIEILVIACNTATSVAIKDLRERFAFPVIGMEPAIKPAIIQSKEGKIILCATDLTIKEKKLNRLIERLNAGDRIIKLSLQELVSMAEKFDLDSRELHNYLEKKFKNIAWEGVSAVVLGCTHFLYYRNVLRTYIPPSVEIIDGNRGTVKRLASFVKQNHKLKNNRIDYFENHVQADAARFEKYLRIRG